MRVTKTIPARAGTVLVGGDEYYGGKLFRLWGWRVISTQPTKNGLNCTPTPKEMMQKVSENFADFEGPNSGVEGVNIVNYE